MLLGIQMELPSLSEAKSGELVSLLHSARIAVAKVPTFAQVHSVGSSFNSAHIGILNLTIVIMWAHIVLFVASYSIFF